MITLFKLRSTASLMSRKNTPVAIFFILKRFDRLAILDPLPILILLDRLIHAIRGLMPQEKASALSDRIEIAKWLTRGHLERSKPLLWLEVLVKLVLRSVEDGIDLVHLLRILLVIILDLL